MFKKKKKVKKPKLKTKLKELKRIQNYYKKQSIIIFHFFLSHKIIFSISSFQLIENKILK